MNDRKVTITFTRYAESNALIKETIDSLAIQTKVSAEVLFLDQQEDTEIADYIAGKSTETIRFVYKNIPAKNLSFARNEAIRLAENNIILFIDSDAIAHDNWAAEMYATLSVENRGVAGGKIVPKWHRPPLLITKSSFINDLYSMLDHGNTEKPVTKIVGASFGLNRDTLGSQAYFKEEFGRRPGVLLGGEESDLVNRCRQNGSEVWYNGKATVTHQVLPERISYSWILKRIYYQGVSRSMVGGLPSGSNKRNRWDYVVIPLVLPVYFAGYFKAKYSS